MNKLQDVSCDRVVKCRKNEQGFIIIETYLKDKLHSFHDHPAVITISHNLFPFTDLLDSMDDNSENSSNSTKSEDFDNEANINENEFMEKIRINFLELSANCEH